MQLRALAFLCFFLSGSTGLMYEVIWTRLLGSVIGNTHFSITMVVSVFMGGLALGSYFGGRLADRSRNPLRLYGLLVFCVGAGCLLVPAAVQAARPLFGALYQNYDGVPEAAPLLLVRLGFSALILLIPTSFMGATLPALARHLAGALDDVGGIIGKLYTINTLGAVAGTAFTGFFGIPRIGIWGCTLLAVALDAAIGSVVLLAARKVPTRGPTPAPLSSTLPTAAPPAPANGSFPALPGIVKLCLLAFGLVGFANMLLQIAWTKAIVLSIGNSTYAFSLIVTLFILGIAVGGGIVTTFVDRVKNLPLLLGALIVATAALVSATIPILGDYPVIASRWFDSIEQPSYPSFLMVHIILVSWVILPSTILMGTVFPIVGKIRTQAIESVGRAVGSAYSWNTLGSILGTLAAGFVFIPLLGRVYWTLYLGFVLSLTVGCVLVFAALPRPPAIRLAAAAGLFAACVLPHFAFLPNGVLGSESHLWHPSLLSRGAYAYYEGSYRDAEGKVIPRQTFIDGVIAQNQVLLYREGIHAPVAVVKNKHGDMAMRISGKVEASLAAGGSYNTDLPHQVMAGHLPMILHPNPRQVITLGLGGGVTLGALTLYPIEGVDNLEISQEVIQAARDFFGEANHGALVNPKVRDVVGDGRNHLEYTRRSYDVITSVPSNPWIAGIGNLFTVEFFRTCRDRLAPGGVICNWIHKINMRHEDFRTVVRTFIEVFGDHAQLWDLGYDALLIGSNAPVQLDATRLTRLLEDPKIRGDLRGLGIESAETLLRHFQMDAPALRKFAEAVTDRPLNTDAFPVLEFSCPYGLYGHQLEAYSSAADADPGELTTAWISGPVDLDRAKALKAALRAYEKVEVLYSKNSKIQQQVRARGGSVDPASAREFAERAGQIIANLKAIAAVPPAADSWLLDRANALAASALATPRAADLRSTLAAGFLASARASAQSPEVRLQFLRDAAQLVENDVRTVVGIVHLSIEVNQPGIGAPLIEQALARQPREPQLLQVRGILSASQGQLDEGLGFLRQALQATSDSALRSEIYQNTGFAFQLAGRKEDAISEYTKAVQENPANEGAKSRLKALLGPGQ